MGVPEIKDENCVDTAKIIVEKLGMNTTVIKAFRVPSKLMNKLKKLVAELNTRQCSSNIIINLRKTKPIANTFHEKWGKKPINVNSYLTIFKRKLLLKLSVLLAKPIINFFGLKT